MARSADETDQVSFVVTYDGPDIVSGQMDAHALGAAMVSIARFIDACAGVTFGAGAPPIRTNVSADFESGSFGFLVVAGADFGAVVHHLIQTMTMKDFLLATGLIGGGGVIGLAKFLKGKKPKEITQLRGGDVEVTADGGQKTVIQAQTMVMFQNSTVRLQLDGIVEPLRREGITQFRTGERGQPQTVVEGPEVDFFEPPAPEGEELQDKVSTEIIQIVSLTFSPGRKWRFKLADGTGFYSRFDDAFSKRVLTRDVIFGAGDALEADLRTVVIRDVSGVLHAQREIVRVLRPIPAPKHQIPLSLFADEDGDRPPQRQLPPSRGGE